MYLPEDLMLQILVRLPAKSLSRFRSVCKTWLAIIDSPSFMSQYLMLTYGAPSNDRNVHLICQNGVFGPTSMTFLLCDEQMIDVKGAPCISDVYEDTNRWFYPGFLGPINGIYCIVTSLSYTCRRTMMFWNPGNGQLHVLPPIPHPVLPHDLEDMYNEWGLDPLNSFYSGFGFDPLAEDYKFMSISEYGDKFAGENHVTCFHVYSLGSNSWQQLVPSEIAYPDVISVYDDAHGHAIFVPGMG